MTQVMKGLRVLELAQWTFVPAATAILADCGAAVIKIEHPIHGDAQRANRRLFGRDVDPKRPILMQHANRGKRNVGIDARTPEGLALVYRLAA